MSDRTIGILGLGIFGSSVLAPSQAGYEYYRY